MYYKFKSGKLKNLLKQAIAKAGSERKLSKMVSMPKGTIYHLKSETRNLSEQNARKILQFLDIEMSDILGDIVEQLPDNWGQRKGGKIQVLKLKQVGKFDKSMKQLRISSSVYMKNWHRKMRINNPEEYHKWQYERFKKIDGGYKHSLSNGTKIRNELERLVGNFLLKHLKSIDYEPYINVNGKAYFPDFKFKNKIIEVTEWKNPSLKKLNYLKKKVSDCKLAGYSVCFFVPERYRKFYKALDCLVVSDLSELLDFVCPHSSDVMSEKLIRSNR